MVFRTLNGRERDVNISQYRVDWDHHVSKPQKAVKDFLRPYWNGGIVLEEFRIPGCKLRVDLLRMDGPKPIMVEVSPESSHSFNKFFHGSFAGFQRSLKHDFAKRDWAIESDYIYIELTEADFPLTTDTFAQWGVSL